MSLKFILQYAPCKIEDNTYSLPPMNWTKKTTNLLMFNVYSFNGRKNISIN